MSPIALRREMRLRGWTYRRRKKGEALFSIGFPTSRGVRGVTRVVQLLSCRDLQISAGQLALFLTRDAALAVQTA